MESEHRKAASHRQRKRAPFDSILRIGSHCYQEFVSQSTDIAVHLVVTLTAEGKSLVKKEGLEKALKLTSSLATTNMVCFDVNGKIKKYASPEEIVDDFYDVRLSYYMKRKVSSPLRSVDEQS